MVHYIFSFIFVSIALVIAVSIVVSKLKTGTATIFGIAPTLIPSDSMMPVIKPWRICLVKFIRAEELEVGDIAVYRFGRRWICHRLCSITEEGKYLFKGDNCSQCDIPVSRGRVKFKVIWYPKF